MDSPVKQPVPIPTEPEKPQPKRNQFADFMTVNLANLPSEITSESLQKLCPDTRLYEIVLSSDNIKGKCAGSGQMGIRYTDTKQLEKTMTNLVGQGITVSRDKANTYNKTLNYAGLAGTKLFDLELTKY